MESMIDGEHTDECNRAARYFADVRRGAREGDEDDRRTLPDAQRALDAARSECGCGRAEAK